MDATVIASRIEAERMAPVARVAASGGRLDGDFPGGGRTAAWPRVVGFCGPIGAGKTTAAEYLGWVHGYTRQRFAGPLKDMMRALGLSTREIDGDLKEMPSPILCGRTPRHAMQTLGTEWGRELIGPDLWISIWTARATASSSPVVADDVRFPNEVAAIKALGGIVIRIERPGALAHGAAAAHASEAYRLAADARVVNDGSVADFERRLARLIGR